MLSSQNQKISSSKRSPQSKKQKSYLGPLWLFECSVIARFLSAQDKLTAAVLLNHAWYELATKNFAWPRFPWLRENYSLLGYSSFILKFIHLTGIEGVQFPGDCLNPPFVELLSTSDSLHLTDITMPSTLETIFNADNLLPKLQVLQVKMDLVKKAEDSRRFSLLLEPQVQAKLINLKELKIQLIRNRFTGALS